jgi:hypothetical protein
LNVFFDDNWNKELCIFLFRQESFLCSDCDELDLQPNPLSLSGPNDESPGMPDVIPHIFGTKFLKLLNKTRHNVHRAVFYSDLESDRPFLNTKRVALRVVCEDPCKAY